MKIATITLNPAIDRSIYFCNQAFKTGTLNRVGSKEATVNAGGKGINVSRMFKKLGVDTIAYGFIGGLAGDTFKTLLEQENIESELIKTACETRTNIKITDENGVETEINELGGPVNHDEYMKLQTAVGKSDAKVFVIGGSVPYGLGEGIVELLVRFLKLHGKLVIVDVSGAPLKKAVEARPYLIKPNKDEFNQLVGYYEFKDEDYPREAVAFYNKTGIEILLTLGKKGAIYCGRAGNFRITNPEIKAIGFTGAGDTFLASYLYAVTNDMDIRTALKFAAAASYCKVQKRGTELPEKKDIEDSIELIAVEEIVPDGKPTVEELTKQLLKNE